jgi:predicted PurR-regulated permease PerM
VQLPPATILFSIVVFSVLAGWLGAVLAVPLAIVLMVIVKELWIRDALGRQTEIPGEDNAS